MMEHNLKVYNTYTHQLEAFVPIHPHNVGIYLCGPTVYGSAHIGHARSAITFDVIVRYLRHLGYDVCYVRNITDVGHQIGDGEEGEDKVLATARNAHKHPMEIAHHYTHGYETDMALLNTLPPSIAPRATGHMMEQISLVQTLLDKQAAYVANGSVYFNLAAYERQETYGQLSGRRQEKLRTGTRTLHQATDKRHPNDFALWKKAPSEAAVAWPSPWSTGLPGWHLECTAMSQKYLGTHFDIHGGGIDLCFPHHECEIAQAKAAYGQLPARYWLHNNLVTIEQQKMSKSAGNFITLQACFNGTHPLLTQAYEPMVLRFFMLQAHYRSTLAFTNDALQAAAKGYYKLIHTWRRLKTMDMYDGTFQSTGMSYPLCQAIVTHTQKCYQAMDEDFNTAKTIAHLFTLRKLINQLYEQWPHTELTKEAWDLLKTTYSCFLQDILGLKESMAINPKTLINQLLTCYRTAKAAGNDVQVAAIREALKQENILLQDHKDSVEWRYGI